MEKGRRKVQAFRLLFEERKAALLKALLG